jgi:4-amino-4-deoxy-L-arabinose transferase-like glycosyltransferase
VLALTISLTTFYDSITGDPKKRVWSAVALGAAVLAKGPVAGLFFILIAVFTYWRMPDLRKSFKGHWLTGFALFALVVAVWYVPCYLANRETFVQQFLIEQNLGRFRGGDLAHKTPIWAIPVYFPLVLFLALMPWSFWAVRAKWFKWPTDTLTRYLWIWGLTVLVFFSASLTKLPHYILPAVAPFVVITVVAVLQRRPDRPHPDQWLKLALCWSGVVCAFATVVFRLDYDKRFAEVHQVAKYLRDKPGYVFLFDVGRQERDTAIKLQINESANPSFLFYLRKEGKMTDDVLDVVEQVGTVWIVTEKGEMAGDLSHNLSLAGFTLTQDVPPFETSRFETWRAESMRLP